MSRSHSYLSSATTIISIYKGEEPFSFFIKKYFAQHKKFGSKDRKQVSHLCYSYFRLGKALPDVPVEERILIAFFLCSSTENEILQELKPGWNENIGLSFIDKQLLTGYKFSVHDIFSWQDELSKSINKEAFIIFHLEQPDLFLRLRPGKEAVVKQKLTKGGIEFRIIADNCVALPNSSKIEELIELDKEAVVQDYSSQRIGKFMELLRHRLPDKELLNVWDCCAASGGKSIMASDILGDINLIVSDVRESILINLEKRFRSAGLSNYKKIIIDLSKPLRISFSAFNFIIADVPCTGSGTWSRTPEQLYFFKSKKIEEYAVLQKKIVEHVVTQLERGGYLLYITCSVFRKENEEVIEAVKEKLNLEIIRMEILEGYSIKADTMFAALMKKN